MRPSAKFSAPTLLALVAATLLSSSTTARAEDHAAGGPPMRTDDPGTPGPNGWEINVAATAEKKGATTTFETPLLDINYGVGKRVQLKIELPWVLQYDKDKGTQTGVGNTVLGVKWRFLDSEKLGLQMSAYPQIGFVNDKASVRKGLVDNGPILMLPIEISKDIGKFTVGGDLGYKYLDRESGWFYGLLGGYKASERVQLLLEVFGDSSLNMKQNEISMQAGTRIKASDHINLLFAAGHSLITSDGEGRTFGYAAFQYNIEPTPKKSEQVTEATEKSVPEAAPVAESPARAPARANPVH